MGAPASGMKAGDQPAAESLLTAFKALSATERRRHASVLNYWLSVRGDKEFPPLHDLDPLELSDAGPNSVLMELISGGHDAEIRHLGEALREEAWPERIIDAPNPSVLACIAKKLPIVAISRDFLAFEDEYEGAQGKVRCSVTLLPLSAGGAWVDYVYALVSVDGAALARSAPAAEAEASDPDIEAPEDLEELAERAEETEAVDEVEEEAAEQTEVPVDEFDDPEAVAEDTLEQPEEPVAEMDEEPIAKPAPGFSKLLDSLAGLTGFYGSQPVKVEPVVEPMEAEQLSEETIADPIHDIGGDELGDEEFAGEAIAEEPRADIEDETPAEAPAVAASQQTAVEGTLQNKLTEVRARADEARMARLRATAALHEGLSAAYDFALDAEDAPEEYLRLVEAQGLKIQLRSPMKPVVKLAFAGMCDDATIKQLEAVLAWAFDEELPRGTLAERIEQAGGIEPILGGHAKAA